MLVRALKTLLTHPLARSVHLDSAAHHSIRAKMIQRKTLLRRIYLNWYRILEKTIPDNNGGMVLEIGSATAFSKQVIRSVVTSDIVKTTGVDIVLDGQYLPLHKESLRGIVMVDVFHHIPDVELFLHDAARCIMTGGVIAMIEPWATLWSGLIYKHFHEEKFAKNVADWKFRPGGPLTAANQALPWIVFMRDRKIFEDKFPGFEIIDLTLHTPVSYLLSGGISMRALWPGRLFFIVKFLESLLVPLNRQTAMFATIVLKKVNHNVEKKRKIEDLSGAHL